VLPVDRERANGSGYQGGRDASPPVASLAAGGEDAGAARDDAVLVQSAPVNPPDSPEHFSQAGAVALVLILAVVDLWLAFSGAGWLHRCGGSLVALFGLVLLVRGVAALAAPHWAERPGRDSRSRHAARDETPAATLAALARDGAS
jgi:hypothetical protein